MSFVQQKRKDEGSTLDWCHVFKTLSRNDQTPLKKLCIMDEIEITPRKMEKLSQNFEKNKVNADPSKSVEVIVLNDEADSLHGANEDL